MTGLERVVSIIAGIITIGNAVMVFPQFSASDSNNVALEVIQDMMVPARVVITTVLEVSLAYFFGRLFVRMAIASATLAWLGWSIIAIFSAWVSLFNLEYVLIGSGASGFGGHLLLFVLLLVVAVVAVHFIEVHFRAAKAPNGITNNAMTVQGLAFLFIFIAACV